MHTSLPYGMFLPSPQPAKSSSCDRETISPTRSAYRGTVEVASITKREGVRSYDREVSERETSAPCENGCCLPGLPRSSSFHISWPRTGIRIAFSIYFRVYSPPLLDQPLFVTKCTRYLTGSQAPCEVTRINGLLPVVLLMPYVRGNPKNSKFHRYLNVFPPIRKRLLHIYTTSCGWMALRIL